MSNCLICGCELDDPSDLTTRDCGGDCLACMAEAGDPDSIAAMEEIRTTSEDAITAAIAAIITTTNI